MYAFPMPMHRGMMRVMRECIRMHALAYAYPHAHACHGEAEVRCAMPT